MEEGHMKAAHAWQDIIPATGLQWAFRSKGATVKA